MRIAKKAVLILCLFALSKLHPQFLQNKYELDESKYEICFVPDLSAYFYIDDIPDGIKTHLKKGLYWEGTINLLIKHYVKEGSLAIDIGAHIGVHTITMSRKAGPKGAVIAFEPQKKIYTELLHNLSINKCKNVIPLRKAVGESFSVIQMAKANPLNEGGTSFGTGGDFAEMIPLDTLNLNNVSLIKIDVERYEYNVFQGAKETILRNKPVIIFEIMGENDYETAPNEIKTKFKEVISLVESFGYEVSVIFGNDFIAFPLNLSR